jgi:hypothetical protein
MKLYKNILEIQQIINSKSSFAQNQRKNAPVTGTTKPGMKSGGRAGYKHGGSTGSSKSSGCEIRGTSPILMKGKR